MLGENPFPYVRAVRGGCTSGNQTLQLHGSSCRTHWYLRPVPAKGKYQGCVAEYLQEPVSALIYCPLTLTLLLTDLTRSKRSLGFVTQTRAGLMTRHPRGRRCGCKSTCWKTYDRHTGGLILHVLTERPPDVLKRHKYLFSRLSSSLLLSVLINTNLTITNYPDDAHKKNHCPCTSACTASKKNAGKWTCERSDELHNYLQMRIAK